MLSVFFYLESFVFFNASDYNVPNALALEHGAIFMGREKVWKGEK